MYKKLSYIYSQDTVKKIWYPVSLSMKHNVDICGSVGCAIATGKATKEPGDIDFVTPDMESALKFANDLHLKLSEYKLYYKVYCNTKTDFLPDTVKFHMRFTVYYWKPICIFVAKEKYETWKYTGWTIQSYDKMKTEKKLINSKRNKLVHIDEPIPSGANDGKQY